MIPVPPPVQPAAIPFVPSLANGPWSPLPGIKAMSIGDVGTGKTTLIKSLIRAGITPFCIFTEPGFDVLGDVLAEKLHWMYIKPMTSDLQNLLDSAKKVGTLNPDQIQKSHDSMRDQRNQYYPILNALAKFTCQRTGQDFGNVGTWGTDKCLVMDSLSGITIAATKLSVGEKYAMTQPEYQIAMNVIGNLMLMLTTGFWCHVYVTAHPAMEKDEVSGNMYVFPSTLGQKLAPTLGRNFTDVFMTKRTYTGSTMKYVIDNVDPRAALKARNFRYGSDLTQDFGPAIDAWKARGGKIAADVPPDNLR